MQLRGSERIFLKATQTKNMNDNKRHVTQLYVCSCSLSRILMLKLRGVAFFRINKTVYLRM